ncbi:cytosolic phospholipase A2 beta-like [Periophthalmus magnuspinnatus]|uniref:cytosolic phospholipase A2 beta-like n=1 Tax=Periophthalmus magnuspinnatus TaxID=409849 RepID=UPI0024367E7F|nr:cytosolic phospholipase A2 beta-like [Periophthalmus magnuspinnatus]
MTGPQVPIANCDHAFSASLLHSGVSQSDLYVTLTLPTATAATRRTKTINNNNNPDWNEKFRFRVPVQTKNVLEICLYDEDLITKDDLVSTVLLDLETLELDSKVQKFFSLGSETKDVLEMEFELLNSKEKPQEYITNGILMAPPLTVMNVKAKNLADNNRPLSKAPKLKLHGAYEGIHTLKEEEWLQFHVNRELETELGLTEEDKREVVPSSIPLKSLPSQQSANISLSLEKAKVDLQVKTWERNKEDLGVRLSLDVPSQEKEFLQKRRRTVALALQALLGLDAPPSDKRVPTVALVASGGGSRACTGFLGSLKGLKEIGVLDAVTYITALSGSTWAMSTLCQEENWSHNLENIISKNRKELTKKANSSFTLEMMHYYYAEMEEKEKQGHLVSYIDMAGLMLEHLLFGQKNTSTLSDQRKTIKNGQNPFPIYTAVNAKEVSHGQQPENEWVEFTPFEVGMQKYGAFVKTENFDSEFFLGHLIKKLPEIRLSYLLGIWSSAFSASLRDLWKALIGVDPVSSNMEPEVDVIEKNNQDSTLDTLRLGPFSGLAEKITGFFKKRPIVNKTFNFTRGLTLHHNYNKNSNFLSWKESHPDAFPNELTPSDSVLHLIDSGHAINIGCPPVLRPERHADVIIVLSYSWDPGNIFEVLQKTSKFCEEHQVAFPSVDYAKLQQQPEREAYVFEDPEMPTTPILVHLPLVNASYREHKAPGVKRETEEELAAGQVDVNSPASPYTTSNFTYSEKDYDALIDLTHYNILHSRDAILSALSKAISRK